MLYTPVLPHSIPQYYPTLYCSVTPLYTAVLPHSIPQYYPTLYCSATHKVLLDTIELTIGSSITFRRTSSNCFSICIGITYVYIYSLGSMCGCIDPSLYICHDILLGSMAQWHNQHIVSQRSWIPLHEVLVFLLCLSRT